MDRLWRSNSSISSRIGCPPSIVNEEDHNVEKHGASVLMCLHDAKSRNFENNIYCMANVSLNDHVYFNHYSETSSPYNKPASKEEDDGKSVDSNFSIVDNFDYFKRKLWSWSGSFLRWVYAFKKTKLNENISKIILLNQKKKKTVLKENG